MMLNICWDDKYKHEHHLTGNHEMEFDDIHPSALRRESSSYD